MNERFLFCDFFIFCCELNMTCVRAASAVGWESSRSSSGKPPLYSLLGMHFRHDYHSTNVCLFTSYCDLHHGGFFQTFQAPPGHGERGGPWLREMKQLYHTHSSRFVWFSKKCDFTDLRVPCTDTWYALHLKHSMSKKSCLRVETKWCHHRKAAQPHLVETSVD